MMASRGSRGAAATAPRAARDPLSRSRENPVAAATAKPRARGAAASAAAASGAPSAPLPNIGAGGGGPSAPEGGAGSIAGAAGAPSGLAALGLPSLHAELRGVFERVGAGSDANAAAVLGRHVPKKTYVMDYKAHDQAVRQIVEECKAALADATARRGEALGLAMSLEARIATRFAEASQLAAALDDAKASRSASAAECARLSGELAQARADLAQAQSNEGAADGEVAHLAALLASADGVAREHDSELARLAGELAEDRDLRRGLEDDIEELRTALAEARAGRDTAVATAASDLARAASAAEADANASARALAALTADNSRLGSDLRSTEARLADALASGERAALDCSRLAGELSSARAARDGAEAELERTRRALEAKDASVAATLAGFNRAAELAMERERDGGARLEAATRERDALRASELDARAAAREAGAREARLTAELGAASARGDAATDALAALRDEHARASAALSEATAAHSRFAAESSRRDAEARQRVEVLHGKHAEAEERARSLAASDAAWVVKAGEWAAREAELLAGRERLEATSAGLAGELKALKDSMGASADVTSIRLAEASKEVATLRSRTRAIGDLNARVTAAEAEAARLRDELFAGEQARRALHNLVQELRGNIRVFVRVRPVLGGDAACEGGDEAVAAGESAAGAGTVGGSETAVVVAADGCTLDLLPCAPRGIKEGAPGATSGKTGKPVRFSFDHVFASSASQADVFQEVSHLVQSALDGFNVCIFSYGQTGSGKTYTMQGGDGEVARGLIPRSVKQILETVAALSSHGWAYTVTASFVEIYNEALRDLLRPAAGAAAAAAASAAGEASAPALTVHQDAEGNAEVPGLTRIAVPDAAAVEALLALAARRRAVACTAMNATSSRSHTVFTLSLRGVHAGKGLSHTGALNLVDLAGSERLARSGAEGDRKRETAAINKSLSCLADVFAALAKRAPHVPFRNSKLTHLLAPCLRGDGKTLMLVNVSPTAASAFETHCSLRFAAQVSQVELGKPTKRVAVVAPQAGAPAAAAMATVVPAAAAAPAPASGELLDVSYMFDAEGGAAAEADAEGDVGVDDDDEGGDGHALALGELLDEDDGDEAGVDASALPASALAAAVPRARAAGPPAAPSVRGVPAARGAAAKRPLSAIASGGPRAASGPALAASAAGAPGARARSGAAAAGGAAAKQSLAQSAAAHMGGGGAAKRARLGQGGL